MDLSNLNRNDIELPRTPLRSSRNASFDECTTAMERQRWYKKLGKRGWIYENKDNPFVNILYTKAVIATELLKAANQDRIEED